MGGVPARHIKYRFNEDIINELIKLDYSKITDEMIERHIDTFYSDIDMRNINKMLDWIPKKS